MSTVSALLHCGACTGQRNRLFTIDERGGCYVVAPHRETPNPKRVGSVWDWGGTLRYSRGNGPSGSSDYFAMSSVPLTVTLATWSTSMIWSKKKPRLIISLPPTSSLFMELLAFDTSILLPSFIVKT